MESLHSGTEELRHLPQLQGEIWSLGCSVLVTVASGSVLGAPLYTWANANPHLLSGTDPATKRV